MGHIYFFYYALPHIHILIHFFKVLFCQMGICIFSMSLCPASSKFRGTTYKFSSHCPIVYRFHLIFANTGHHNLLSACMPHLSSICKKMNLSFYNHFNILYKLQPLPLLSVKNAPTKNAAGNSSLNELFFAAFISIEWLRFL